MIEAASRLRGVERLIDTEQYFVIHAARQSGKTTYLKDLTRRLNASGEYYALYCSLESIQGISSAKEAIPSIVRTIQMALEFSDIPGGGRFAENADFNHITGVLRKELSLFCMRLNKPLAVVPRIIIITKQFVRCR
jgi:hypothetical protein